MLTKQTFEEDLKEALRAGDDVRKRTLRMVLTAVKLAEVDRGEPLDEAELWALLQKEVKTRRESIEEAERAGREDLVASTQAEIEVLEAYLPKPYSEQELEALACQTIEEVDATGPESMGLVMKNLMPKVQGRADGKQVNQLVRRLLSEI